MADYANANPPYGLALTLKRSFKCLLHLFRIRDPVGDQKRQEEARLLRIEIERHGETQLIILDLDIAVDEARAYARRAHHQHAALGGRGERVDRGLGGIAVTDARAHDDLG